MSFAPPTEEKSVFLGRGSSKSAFLSVMKGKRVAKLSCNDSKDDLRHEIEIMRQINRHPHQNVLSLLCVIGREMVVPLAPNVSIVDLSHELDFKCLKLTKRHARTFDQQLTRAAAHLTACCVEHNDLRCNNGLVFAFVFHDPEKSHVKLGDFGDAVSCAEAKNDLVLLREELYGFCAKH